MRGRRLGDVPSTPAELPMNEPRRVIELRMLLMRSLLLDTASGRKAPSLNPHKPPTPRPAVESELMTQSVRPVRRVHSPGSRRK